MHVRDRIYGAFQIQEPVLLDLLASQAMARLRGVLQHGISGLIGVTVPTTRYEHSLGVMLLVRRLGAGLQEQIAALLHDVSHTAFSHVIDYVYGRHKSQTYHEQIKETFVAQTDIPSILERHGYAWCDFICLDDVEMAERFPLLEQESPALCADRLDYFLRDAIDLNLATKEQAEEALEHLVVHRRRIVCDQLEPARWLGYTFIAADKASWANFREVALYELTAKAIRHALDIGILLESDLMGRDLPAWEKLHTANDPVLQRLLALVSPETEFVWDPQAATFWVDTKLRSIDPSVLENGKAVPLSALDAEFAETRNTYLKERDGKWPVKVISNL
jgi:hypothetical protein